MILQNGKRIDGCSDTVPVGTLQPYLGLVPPKGYLVCQGQLVSKITYSKLYEICGDTFGTSTSTHFYLPDLRGKTVAGYNADDSAMNSIGKLLGSNTHKHTTGNHTLTIAEMPSHNHQDGKNDEGITATVGGSTSAVVHWDSTSCELPTTSTGGGQAHNHGDTGVASNFQPTMVMNWIVKAAMLIPDYIIVEDKLTSDSAVDALSARQGKILNEKFTDYATKSEMIQYLPLNGGKMTGEIVIGQADGYGIQMGTNGRINATLGGATNATVLGILDSSVIVGHGSAPLTLRGSANMPSYNGVAFIDTGSNTNGTWTKFADGTMICRHTKSISVDCTSQWGNLYEGGASAGSFPATFSAIPTVMVTNTTPDGYFEGLRDSSTTSWGTIRMAIPTSATRSFVVNLLAIGRWK